MRNRQAGSRWVALAEIGLIFVVFAIQGAWPVPDVNEAYYLGKAIHYWNPAWLSGDSFMESADTHKVFYFTFGWLSLWLGPVALAWTGRVLTWLLLAWAWRRLSVAVVPRRWYSILTAALFGCLMERCHMAGEWVIGGVEAKGFAYVFVFLGLESLVRNRWNRGLTLFGAAAAFHVIVGAWAAVAAGVAWLWLALTRKSEDSPPLRSLWPGILGGMLLSLPGLIPSLMLDWGVDRATVREAHQIYVFERLPHHLVLSGIRPEFILRLALLWIFWIALGQWRKREWLPETRRLRALVCGAVTITMAGVLLHVLIFVDRALVADFLRYYWFRWTDVMLPLGVALEGVAIAAGTGRRKAEESLLPKMMTALAIVIAMFHVGDHLIDRMAPSAPRSHRIADFDAWQDVCRWVVESGKIAPDAKFLVPRDAQTFKWNTGHSDVAVWKDVPQNAEALVQWHDRIHDIYATNLPTPPRWYEPLATRDVQSLVQLGEKYHADYLISERTEPPLTLPIVYENRTYLVYRLR